MRDVDIAYLAGFVDGDGGMNICLHMGRYHRLQLEAATTEKTVPEWIHSKYGGTLNHRVRTGKYKDVFRWIVHSKQAEKVLRDILPFLRIRKRQAELALEFRETKVKRGQRVSNELWEKRENIRKQISQLNRGGVS